MTSSTLGGAMIDALLDRSGADPLRQPGLGAGGKEYRARERCGLTEALASER